LKASTMVILNAMFKRVITGNDCWLWYCKLFLRVFDLINVLGLSPVSFRFC
jgi:hypothetical protein